MRECPNPILGLVLLLGTAVLVGARGPGQRGVRDRGGGGAVRDLGGAGADAGVDAGLRLRDAGAAAVDPAWRDVDWTSLRAALAGRLPLTPVGVWVVAVSSPRLIALLVGVLVLVVALASAYAPGSSSRAPRNLFLAGALTGISGTSAAVGGPFVAMTLAARRAGPDAGDAGGVLHRRLGWPR